MKIKLFLLAIVIIIFTIICCAISILALSWVMFSVNSGTRSEYIPEFTSTEGEQIDMELVQIESDVFLFVHKDRTGVDSLSEFNDKYEVIQYSNIESSNEIFTQPDFEKEETEQYLVLAYESWINVYCTGIFKEEKIVNFGTGRIFDLFPAPSEAWMCSEKDVDIYPEE